jgi:hypothetical protein
VSELPLEARSPSDVARTVLNSPDFLRRFRLRITPSPEFIDDAQFNYGALLSYARRVYFHWVVTVFHLISQAPDFVFVSVIILVAEEDRVALSIVLFHRESSAFKRSD